PAANPRFNYDRSGVAAKIGTDIKTEKHALKTVLKDEFAWFKKDSLSRKPSKQKEEEDVMQIEDENTSGNKTETTNKKNSTAIQKRKEAFKNLKNKLKDDDE